MPWYVNDEQVDDGAVREEARMMRPRFQESFPDMDPIESEMQLKEWARENVIERILLRQTALADPEPVPEEFLEEALHAARTEAGGQAGCGLRTSDEEVRKQAEVDFRTRRVIERMNAGVKPPSEKEITAYYKQNREQFQTPELCWAKHIVINAGENRDEAAARAAIEQAEAELKSGAVFEEVADRASDCAGNGGDLGWFPRGEMVDRFESAVFDLPIGQTTGIFESEFGFHIARVYGRRPAGVRPLNEVREQIARVLLEQKRHAALEEYLDGLRAKADIRQSKAIA